MMIIIPTFQQGVRGVSKTLKSQDGGGGLALRAPTRVFRRLDIVLDIRVGDKHDHFRVGERYQAALQGPV